MTLLRIKCSSILETVLRLDVTGICQNKPVNATKADSHIDQSNESDIYFIERLGKLHDAVATIKKDALIFLSISESSNSKGKSSPTGLLSVTS